jgi:hypothetical protein
MFDELAFIQFQYEACLFRLFFGLNDTCVYENCGKMDICIWVVPNVL